MDGAYDKLRAVSSATGDTPLGEDIPILPLKGTIPIVMKARPFPAYDNPSSKVILLTANERR